MSWKQFTRGNYGLIGNSEDYEREPSDLRISLGGDAITLACITGGIAGAFYVRGSTDNIAVPGLGAIG